MHNMVPIGLFTRVFLRVVKRRWQKGPQRPSWSLLIEAVNEIMRENLFAIYKQPVTEVRQQQERFAESLPSPPLWKVRRQPARIGGVDAEWLVPKGIAADSAPVLLYFHGGAYVLGSSKTHADVVAALALSGGARALLANYRLAPEHLFPAALEDALAVYEGLLAMGVEPGRIVVSGDSAGGGLGLALLRRLQASRRPLPAAGLLISPWVDLSCSRPSLVDHARYDFGDREMLLYWANMYRGEVAATDPRISPLYDELHGLPPLCIFAGSLELLVDEIKELVDKARAAKVQVDFTLAADMTHCYPLAHLFVRPAAEAIRHAGDFIRARTA